ncbi:MAG: hypothetical protein HY077_05395 [Elusimicrobia bacterium]|nr:hypothetical protein [Elusimicrobiota bacterium]
MTPLVGEIAFSVVYLALYAVVFFCALGAIQRFHERQDPSAPGRLKDALGFVWALAEEFVPGLFSLVIPIGLSAAVTVLPYLEGRSRVHALLAHESVQAAQAASGVFSSPDGLTIFCVLALSCANVFLAVALARPNWVVFYRKKIYPSGRF